MVRSVCIPTLERGNERGYALRDPRAAAIFARRTLEASLKWLFDNDNALKALYEKSLAPMIYKHESAFCRYKVNHYMGLRLMN